MATIARREAEKRGLSIDETCFPNVAYIGHRFAPDERYEIVDPTYFRLYLDLSTAHISEQTAAWLTAQAAVRRDGGNADLAVYDYAEGFFLPVPSEASYEPIGLASDLSGLFKLARDCGAELIRLDLDGGVCDDLPKFDW